MSQHDEIVAKIREALPEAEEWTKERFDVIAASGRCRGAIITLQSPRTRLPGVQPKWVLNTERIVVHPDRLDDAITIARLWATLGEPR